MFSGKLKGIEYAWSVVSLPENWEFPQSKKSVFQLVRPEEVKGEKHLLHCIILTHHAFQDRTNIASQPELELLLRLAGTRQINRALKKMRPEDKAVLVVYGDHAEESYKKLLEELGAEETREELKIRGGFEENQENEEKEAMERAALISLG